MATDNNATYEVWQLHFSYGKNEVLKGITFDLHEGVITTIIGANGCGKSTLFNLMTKNLTPDRGDISFCGRALADIRLKDFAKQAAIVHQYNTALDDITVEKLFAYGRTPYHTFGLSPDAAEDEKKVRWAMEITDTLKHKDKPVSQLSGGQKQRLCIARAISVDPEVLLLDEPCSALDVKATAVIEQMLCTMKQSYTMVMVTHNIAQARRIADHVAVLYEGRLVEFGPAEDIFAHPKEQLTREFLGGIYG